MNNELKIFENAEFGEIRTIEIDGKPYFVAKDVATALGYKDTTNAIKQHCKGVVKHHLLTNGGKQLMSIIPEGDLYRLITNSELPNAEKFESWVFDEVLPSIRKNGGYISEQKTLSDEQIMAQALLVAQRMIDDKNKQIEKMKNGSIEYEESGFIAGFKTAIALLCGQEELLPTPTHFPTPKEEKPRHKEISKPQGDINFDFISTKTIAAMFATSNWKVVNRIEKYILPECSEQECKGFFKCTEKNEQRKMVEIYKLNHEACKIYIKYMSLSRKYVNVSAGIGKMEEMMQAVFLGNGKTVSA